MAKRAVRKSTATAPTSVVDDHQSPIDHGEEATATFERRVVAFAEQVGRLAGTVSGKADALIDRRALEQQVAAIRDAAARLLGTGTGHETTPAPAAPRSRSGGKVDAPGKKHRKAPARARGVKHSEQSIAKLATSRQRRPARRG